MNMHGLIWNQLNSPVYRDMLLWSWRHTDPAFDNDELENGYPPRMVEDIQFDLGRRHICGVPGCNKRAFVRCSHCHKLLCLDHFLERVCFHSRNVTVAVGNRARDETSSPRSDDDSSSGSAIAGAVAASSTASGAVAGVAVTGVAVGVGAASISASVASGTAIRQDRPHKSSSDNDEIVPLIEIRAPEETFVQMPPSSLTNLIRSV